MSPQETVPPATSGASAVAGIECPACGTQNTNDSKFCRHCGHLLRPLPSVNGEARRTVAVDGEALEDDNSLTSPAEIDARRARQLLDRALLMSERGDLNAALLACRQAIALDHDHSESYALLGTLLERNGDLRGAMNAYEHVLEIEPDNELERDSLNRIKARLERAPAFNFNPNDLFGEDNDLLPSVATSTDDVTPVVATTQENLTAIAPEREEHGIEARLPPTSASVAAVAPAVAAAVPLVDAASFDFDAGSENLIPAVATQPAVQDSETPLQIEAALPPTSESVLAPVTTLETGTTSKIDYRLGERRQANIPVGTDRRSGDDRRADAVVAGATFAPSTWPAPAATPVPAPATIAPVVVPSVVTPSVVTPRAATTPSTVAPLDFSFGTTPPPPTPLWAQMLRGSSFYGRTLPLIVVGVLGLGFLSWARSQAVARDTAAITGSSTAVDQTDGGTTVAQNPSQPQDTFASSNAPGVTPAPVTNSGGFPITNATTAPAPAVGNTTNPASTSNAPATAPNRAPANPSSPTGSGVLGGSSSAGRTNGGTPPFPVPIAPAPVPPAPSRNTTTTPSDNSTSSGGNIVLPPPQTANTGGGDTGRIRVGSLGGAPLSPGGAPQEGRIRITQGNLGAGGSVRSAPPPRTGAAARTDERAASAAAANGNQDRAINSLTNAINSTGADRGYLLQQRAMAFMDRGDYARAVEDFQASIGAYQDQINSGENVASAQAGIRSARSGLNLALSRR